MSRTSVYKVFILRSPTFSFTLTTINKTIMNKNKNGRRVKMYLRIYVLNESGKKITNEINFSRCHRFAIETFSKEKKEKTDKK